jgi:hypothetical protein
MRSGSFLNKTTGQLPHHFVNDVPTYLALSGATQTGPNIFWTRTALRYAAITGDLEWLKDYLPVLRNASDFCFNLIDPDIKMINAPGSLMIDVFVRGNYTSDSNGMMVSFLDDFAQVEDAVGDSKKATLLRKMSKEMAMAMNTYLWANQSSGSDHYITQLDLDLSTIRDFVDYDANLIAAYAGVPSAARAQALFARIDAGTCSANAGGGPQWVSEKYYGPKDTLNGNIGDSRCSMGRIAWFDAHARKRYSQEYSKEYSKEESQEYTQEYTQEYSKEKDREQFSSSARTSSLDLFNANLLLLQNNLIEDTWMHERYGCDGKQQLNRTMYYFEYPSTVVMLLREIRYGINMNFANIVIQPWLPADVTNFTYNIGNVYVMYDALRGAVNINVPGNRQVSYEVYGMPKNRLFEIVVDGVAKQKQVMSDKYGKLVFTGMTGCLVQASAGK